MSSITLRTASRLHFGLLAWGPDSPRQFGGVGLMVDHPGLTINAEPAPTWTAEGPLASRALDVAARVSGRLRSIGIEPVPARLRVTQAPPEHVGLGVGTQLGLAVARLVCELAEHRDVPIAELAEHAGRGLRSGIGLHGFSLGGLVVDGGRRGPGGIPPLLARLEFPTGWSVLVVVPPLEVGLHGPSEIRAFAELPPFPEALVDRLCRLVLLGLLPAVAERDLPAFGASLEELQARVGQSFAPAQGGQFASARLESMVAWLRAEGLAGVGQSSWGPTLYAFTEAPADRKAAILAALADRFDLPPGSARWTTASPAGASLAIDAASTTSQ